MRYGMRGLAVAACAALLIVALNDASSSAQTPLPVSTPTVLPSTPTEGMPTVGPLPEARETATFIGNAWVNAVLTNDPVLAIIGDTVCGEARRFVPVDSYAPVYEIQVVSAAERPGCGYEGAQVIFQIGEKKANETGAWHAGETTMLVLTVGPPFAQFYGTLTLDIPPANLQRLRVTPYVNGTECGYQLNPWQGEGPTYGYHVVVYSAETKAGCGTNGAQVTFKLLDQQDRKVAAEAMGRATWRPMAFDKDVNLAFTEVPVVQVPVAGSDGGQAGMTWAPLVAICVVLLPAAGLSWIIVRGRQARRNR